MKNILIVDQENFLTLPVIDTNIAIKVCEITDTAAVKRKLMRTYGDVDIVADGNKTSISSLENAVEIEIAAQPVFAKNRYNVADVLRVIDRLTWEDGGCPWDKVQTHESIRINMIEEAYEAVDAIDKRDVANMREEFGDVLLQSVLQSDISRRSGEFDFDDVCDELCKKLIGRHTFIFGSDSAGNADEALVLWEKAKAVEKNYDSVKTQLSKLPDNFPSLLLCQKTYKKLKKAGADISPEQELKKAISGKHYAEAICACAELIADEGGDAEVELNKLVKNKIASL